jgi:competence protein ComEC
MHGVFFYIIVICFASGIFLRSLFVFDLGEIAVILFLGFTYALLWRVKGARNYFSPLFLVSLTLCSLAFGMFRLDHEEAKPEQLSTYVNAKQTIEGVVVREPDVREGTVHLTVAEHTTGELVLVTTDPFVDVRYGDLVKVEGELEEPSAFETDLGRTFNYPGYLKAQNIRYTMSFVDVQVVGHGAGNAFIAQLLYVKHGFMRSVEAVLPEPQAGLSEGLLLGAKRAIGEDLEIVFRKTGIIHIVVLSGYNVMLVAEAIMRLLAVVLPLRARVIVGIVAISMFALLVGLSATVVRASIMAGLVLLAHATGRMYAVLRALTFAGVIMLIINPYLLVYDPGFQLSFLATLGLVLLAPLIERVLGFVPSMLQIREFVTATIATQIMVLPLLLYLIGEFSIVSVLVNVLVLPMVPVAMLLTFATGTLFALLPTLGIVTGFVAHLSLSYILTVADLFSRIPYASVSVPSFSFVLVVAGYALIGSVLVVFCLRKNEDVVVDRKFFIEDFSDWTVIVDRQKT